MVHIYVYMYIRIKRSNKMMNQRKRKKKCRLDLAKDAAHGAACWTVPSQTVASIQVLMLPTSNHQVVVWFPRVHPCCAGVPSHRHASCVSQIGLPAEHLGVRRQHLVRACRTRSLNESTDIADSGDILGVYVCTPRSRADFRAGNRQPRVGPLTRSSHWMCFASKDTTAAEITGTQVGVDWWFLREGNKTMKPHTFIMRAGPTDPTARAGLKSEERICVPSGRTQAMPSRRQLSQLLHREPLCTGPRWSSKRPCAATRYC